MNTPFPSTPTSFTANILNHKNHRMGIPSEST